MAYRVLFGLAAVSAVLSAVLFVLHAFSYPIAVFVTAVFTVGALVARRLPRRR